MIDLVVRYRFSLAWIGYIAYLISVWQIVGATR